MLKYTHLKEFAKGMAILAKKHGDVPVFLEVDNKTAPFGMALAKTELLGGNAIVLIGGTARPLSEFSVEEEAAE